MYPFVPPQVSVQTARNHWLIRRPAVWQHLQHPFNSRAVVPAATAATVAAELIMEANQVANGRFRVRSARSVSISDAAQRCNHRNSRHVRMDHQLQVHVHKHKLVVGKLQNTDSANLTDLNVKPRRDCG